LSQVDSINLEQKYATALADIFSKGFFFLPSPAYDTWNTEIFTLQPITHSGGGCIVILGLAESYMKSKQYIENTAI
jgi:hypothetical protein